MAIEQIKMTSKIGPLYLVASDQGLRGIYWKKQPLPASAKANPRAQAILAKTQSQLEEYLDGRRREFSIPLDAQGTEFQTQVWEQLGKIPYGTTVSYREIARRIRNEKAVRAVGSANGKNPLCIILPCHRVVASDGSLGGYSGGLRLKRKLLDLEFRSMRG